MAKMSQIRDDGGIGATTKRSRRGKSGKRPRHSSASGGARRSHSGGSSTAGGAKRELATTVSAVRGTSASVWPHTAPQSGTAETPALELAVEATGSAADTGLLDALLELVGTEHLTLGHALSAWQREQDRLANRAWRRPGGLARPAGL